MSDHVQEALGLKSWPFSKAVSPDMMWLDADRSAAVERLVDTVTHRQHALVTGEPGVGKTTVLRALRHRLSPTRFRTFYLAHVTLGRRDFYRQICFALQIQPKAMAAAMFEAIQRECIQGATEHRVHAVLVIDEAQLMPDDTMAHLHLLANFEWDSDPLLSLVFVGLPELHDKLRKGIHRSLLTRIHTHVELSPGSPDLTATYVRKRLRDAGAKTELFTADGLAMLHQETGGLLRSVDILATAALRLAVAEDTTRLDRGLVRRALRHTPLA
ncbi:MAG: AAA family ATPase [Oligoflexia bacterium]|nr:AAA family ATPase [Oligoflexia bacterium]